MTESAIRTTTPAPRPSKVAGVRKEAVWLTFRAKSKRELLDRLTENKFGTAWKIQIGDAEPISLRDWLVENHPVTAEVAADETVDAEASE